MALRIHGNRLMKTLPGQTTRPTPARVREALFNVWQGAIADCSWLDLCAGSGAMGAEALSRGAQRVVGIERLGKACAIIQANWQTVADPHQSFKIIKGDVVRQLQRLQGESFDRIYFDPPYASDLYGPVLNAIAIQTLLSSQGEIAVEYTPAHWQPIPIVGLTLVRKKRYGTTGVVFYEREKNGVIE
ncbi:MAG: 16S rRNA (guanine(966)-N(2))-methyltransferase RsmD [Cyanobacteria bacterium J06635_15]